MVNDINKYKEKYGLSDYYILKSILPHPKLCINHNSNPSVWLYMEIASYDDILRLKDSNVFLVDKDYTIGTVERFGNLEELCKYILIKKLAVI